DPPQVRGLPPGQKAEQKSDRHERRLHGEAALVGRLELGEQRAVVEAEPRRLLGNVDEERGAAEERGDDERKLSGDHGFLRIRPAVSTPYCGSSNRSSVIGNLRTRTPVACHTALATAPALPVMPISPTPLMPSAFTCGSRSSTRSASTDGTSAFTGTWYSAR